MKILRKKTPLILAVLFVFISLTIRGQNNPNNCFALMRTQPYLQMPTENSMVVRWVTTFPCAGEVEYSTHPTLSSGVQRISSTETSFTHKFQLTNLKAGTKYYYRVRSSLPQCNGESGTELSGIYSFKTINPDTTEYKILVLSDLHPVYPQYDVDYMYINYNNNRVYEILPEIISGLDYDLTVFNGDNMDNFEIEGDMIWWIDHFNRWVRNESIPSVYVMGNHEYDGILADQENHRHQNLALRKYLDFVKDGQTYGKLPINKSTELLFLDTGLDIGQHNGTIDLCPHFTDLYKAQHAYVKNTIVPDKTKKRILFHHIPLFGNYEGINPYYDALQAKELNNANILLSVNGHGHIIDAQSKSKWNEYNSYTPIHYPLFFCDGPKGDDHSYKDNRQYTGSVVLLHLINDEIHITSYLIKRNTFEVIVRTCKVIDGTVTFDLPTKFL